MMTRPALEADSAEDVNDFLLRIRELGEKRDKEDEERTRKLEEEILQGRREREARRAAERARSISPTKDVTLQDSPRIATVNLDRRPIDAPSRLEPSMDGTSHYDSSLAARDTTAGSRRAASKPAAKETSSAAFADFIDASFQPSSSPPNQDNDSASYFTSDVMSAPQERSKPASEMLREEQEPSRSQIAQSLASRDPSCFRQTPDRVFGSPALRKDPDTANAGPTYGPAGIRRLPGMSRESTAEPETATSPDPSATGRSRSPSKASSSWVGSGWSNRYSSVSSISTGPGLGAPIPLSTAIKHEPAAEDGGLREVSMTPSSPGRPSTADRPVSPTKGLGGFVQSAMMKRSDTVAKRVGVPNSPGFGRTGLVGSRPNTSAGSTSGDVAPTTPRSRHTPQGSPRPYSRPSSSHSEATVVHNNNNNNNKGDEGPTTPPMNRNRDESRPSEALVRPQLPAQTRSENSVEKEDHRRGSRAQTPSSPMYSRTMDPKRWSPTKASWLESALNRPETSKPKPQAPQQPPWMRDRQKVSIDIGRTAAFKEVTPVGLMRSPPPGTHFKKPSVVGVPSMLVSQETSPVKESASPVSAQFPEHKINPVDVQPAGVSDQGSSTESAAPAGTKSDSVVDSSAAPKQPPPVLTPKPNVSLAPSSIKDSGLSKAKTQSPAVDFRANLRRRETPKDTSSTAEPEFKNVFGKLKKTETSNYVAPDELKNNILRGKAGLTITGGPKKTQRVDEFKENILKQKEAMKAGGGSLRRNAGSETDVLPKPVSVVPEAIARRSELAKSTSAKGQATADTPIPISGLGPKVATPKDEKTHAPEAETDSSDTPAAIAGKQNSSSAVPEAAVTASDVEKTASKEVETASGLQPDISRQETIRPVRALPSERVAVLPKPAAKAQGLAAKGALAGRINPALAGILSRGPPAAGNASKTVSSEDGPRASSPAAAKTQQPGESESSAPLTHMTKNRARGPKRRLPKESPVETGPPRPREHEVSSGPVKEPARGSRPTISSKPAQSTSATPSPTEKPGLPGGLAAGRLSKPAISSQSVGKPSQASPEKLLPDKIISTNGSTSEARSTLGPTPRLQSPIIPRKSEDMGKRDTGKPTVPVKPTPNSSATLNVRTAKSPVLTPTALKPNQRPSTVETPSPLVGLGLGGSVQMPLMTANNRAAPVLPPKKPDLTLAKPLGLCGPSTKPTSPTRVPLTAEAIQTISKFFNAFPKSSDRVEIDPQLVLTADADDHKIRTLQRQIWEITGDGKRQELPVNQEYILYEGSMYVCVHSFEQADGSTRSEVHLWCGDEVGEAAVEDAQLFARKVARDSGCKLEVLRQGKETARFMQALGGILITRRGSSSRSSASATYMLCGRRHLRQMAFDEVDIARKNLCSGYPFVISAPFGKLYLWKGKGSGAEEVGAARLIGMDLGLTGEIEEVEEGREPRSFFDIFSDKSDALASPVSSDHWHLKPHHQHYGCRLLRVDHELGQRQGFWIRRPGSPPAVVRPNDTVQAIEPYCQQDISAKGIYVLDTFFEIYVIVGEEANQRPAEFASAVVFAHEYGILSASLQDRPFIPKSYVAIGGVPDACLSAFRKWTRRPSPRSVMPKVLPLDAAIEAIRS